MLTIRALEVSLSEHKSLPDVSLELGSFGACLESPQPEYLRFVGAPAGTGEIAGRVTSQYSVSPISGVEVTVMCGGSRVCGTTRTDAKGQFRFKRLPAGPLSVRLRKPRYYDKAESGYMVLGRVASTYRPVSLQRCATADCDPESRPKPLFICE